MRASVALAVLALAACTDLPAGGSDLPSPSTSVRSESSSQPHTGGRVLFVRTCESSVSGALGAGWRKGEVTAGPVVFVGSSGYADDPASLFTAPPGRATVQKVLLVVSGGEPAEVSVGRPDAAIFYDPNRWRDRNVVPFGLGDPAVRFEPCGGGHGTQFNGGFLVRGPSCVPVAVRAEGLDPVVAMLSFGAGACG